jgi:hypothetical protein
MVTWSGGCDRPERQGRSRAAGARVLCIAHVTNTMGQAGDDFEKGEADGTKDALAALAAIIAALRDPPHGLPR